MYNLKNKCQDKKKLTVRPSNQPRTAANQHPTNNKRYRLKKSATIQRAAKVKLGNRAQLKQSQRHAAVT